MKVDEPARVGARKIIACCLGLRRNQSILLIADEMTVPVATVLAEECWLLGVEPTTILVPVSAQQRIPLQSDLSLLLQTAAREAHAILTCVNNRPDCLGFRTRVLRTQWNARVKIGHMPGATLNVLRMANVDFERLVEDCRRLEVAMARGRSLEVITNAPDGTTHCLQANIGGWEQLPVASDGVIREGAWGNVPSGETFIAPLPESGKGSVVIDGSVPGRVIAAGKGIVLCFSDGRLQATVPSEDPTVRWLRETQFGPAQAQGDSNWPCLAEIGIGLSTGLRRLTGNMLLDEKAAGTAHIALGSNSFLGGTLVSSIHCDLVFRHPTILIDGKPVLETGKLVLRDEDWYENYAHVVLSDSPLVSATAVGRSGVEAHRSADGRLQRVLRSGSGRVSSCWVGEQETARLAGTVEACLPQDGSWLAIDDLTLRTGLPRETLLRLLHVLWDYELLRLR